MFKWKGILVVFLSLAFVLPAYGRVRKKGYIRKEVVKGYERVKNAFQISYGLGATLIEPAGFDVADVYPEVYVPIEGLSFGFNLGVIPVIEGAMRWGITIDFVNVKYTWIPKKFSRLQPYFRTGWGIFVYEVDLAPFITATNTAFDWVFGSGLTFWFTDNAGGGTDFTVHATSDGTFYIWLYSFRYRYGW